MGLPRTAAFGVAVSLRVMPVVEYTRASSAQGRSVDKWINRCFIGDVREGLRSMVADGVRVQCAITSLVVS